MAAAMAAGGGGGRFIADMTASIDNLVAAANTGGGFTVSDAGGQALIGAIDTYKAKLEKSLSRANFLTQRLPLGSSPAATTFAPFLTTVASDQVQGAIPAMQNLRQRLEDARAAIQRSMASYQQTDQQSASNLKSQGYGA